MKPLAVVIARPPMFEKIDAVFSISDKSVIFAWGDRIYNPMGVVVTKELQAHEQVHAKRQGDSEESVVAWWEKYLVDRRFRLEEELPAHRAEYSAYCRRHGSPNDRYRALGIVAGKLAHPLYGELISLADARVAIMTGVLP